VQHCQLEIFIFYKELSKVDMAISVVIYRMIDLMRPEWCVGKRFAKFTTGYYRLSQQGTTIN
jgi:hypothetical protein